MGVVSCGAPRGLIWLTSGNWHAETGVLKLQKIPEGDMELITVKDLRADRALFPMTFAELKARKFPVSAFEAAKICPRSVWPMPGDRLPLSLTQLNFIQGGVIMGWKTYYTWSQVWAEECRRVQGEEILNPIHLPDQIFAHRAQISKASGRNAGRVKDHPEYLVLPCKEVNRGTTTAPTFRPFVRPRRA